MKNRRVFMLKDLLKKSRSYRSFDESVTFTEEQLKEFVDHVRYAPSSINGRRSDTSDL